MRIDISALPLKHAVKGFSQNHRAWAFKRIAPTNQVIAKEEVR